MKYPVQNYAKALVAAIEAPGTKDKAAIGKNFLAVVQKNGDEAGLRKILEEAGRMARGKSGIREVSIASARPLTKAQQAAAAKFTRPGDVAEYSVDAGLIAGVKITVNDEMQFDGTLKAKLDKLFGAGG